MTVIDGSAPMAEAFSVDRGPWDHVKPAIVAYPMVPL
jgi:hypothetical protein